MLATLVVFCKPDSDPVTWRSAILILLLYCLAVLSKEQAVVLPAAFLVIDMVLRAAHFEKASQRDGAFTRL